MAGAEFIRDNKDEEKMEIESTDDEKMEIMNNNKITKKLLMRRIWKKQKHCLYLA